MELSGRYRLTRRLGQGGMAEVLEGVSEGAGGFRRRVAVKRILPHLASDAACSRMFLDEARIASHLHHANIVSVLDFGTLDGVPFQVLEFVDGVDLDRIARLCEERKVELPAGIALHIITQVAYALEHAHRAKDEQGQALGIVHRDVSPSNVLVSWEGHVKLGDFGIALAENRLERTQNDGIKGKLEYMSPEQAVRGGVDARTDVFALGCTLHRLLAGESPLSDLSALTRLISGEELTLAAHIPDDIRALIAKATRCARVERYGSAAELASALGALVPRYLHEEPTGALRKFLATLREEPEAPKPKRGALDALLNLELVLADTGDGEQRAFTSQHAATTVAPTVASAGESKTTVPAGAQLGEVESGSDAELVALSEELKAPRRSWGWIFGVVLLGLVSGGILWGTRRTADPLPALSRGERVQGGERVPAARVVTAEVPVAAPTPAPVAVEPSLPKVDPSTVQRATHRHGRGEKPAARATETTPPAPAPTAKPVSPESEGRGTLVIGGTRAQRAEIRIDGHAQGFAPKRLEVPAGDHEILLVSPDGTRIGPHVVHVDSRHTPSAPAKWIVD